MDKEEVLIRRWWW